MSDFYDDDFFNSGDDDFFNSESDDEEEEIINAPEEKLSQEAGLGGSSFFGSLSDFSYSGSSGFSRLMRWVGSRIRKPLAKAYIKAFGDPRSVKEIFNIHGPEVNLIQRQQELLIQACQFYRFCEGFEDGEIPEHIKKYLKEKELKRQRARESSTLPY